MIYLLRHGEIEGASVKSFIGRTNGQLSQQGRAQARAWRGYFRGRPIAQVWSSPMDRALDTACLACGTDRGSLVRRPGLREIDLGTWEGMPFGEIQALYPEAWAARGRDLAGFRPPGGESFMDLQRRVVPVLDQALDVDGDLVIVAHAGVNRMILCHVLGRPVDHLFTIPQDYGALNIICQREGAWEVAALNQLPERAGGVQG